MNSVSIHRQFAELFFERLASRFTPRWFLRTLGKYVTGAIAGAAVYLMFSRLMSYRESAQISITAIFTAILFLLTWAAIYRQNRLLRDYNYNRDHELQFTQWFSRMSLLPLYESRFLGLDQLRSEITSEVRDSLRTELRREISYDFYDKLTAQFRSELSDRMEKEIYRYSRQLHELPPRAFFDAVDYFTLTFPNTGEIESVASGLKSYLEGMGFIGTATVGHRVETAIHRIVFEIPSSQPRGTILRVLIQGYRYFGTGEVVRDAYVAVSSGGETTSASNRFE